MQFVPFHARRLKRVPYWRGVVQLDPEAQVTKFIVK